MAYFLQQIANAVPVAALYAALAFGYAIALGGLVYYKLGRDGVNNLLAQVRYQVLGGPRPEN